MSTALDHSQKQEAEKQTPPWHQAYPPPRNSNTPLVSRQELLLSFRDGKVAGKDFVLVDLRRNDHEGGTIHGSINLPAQSLYPSIPTLYTLFAAAKVEKVIWYCGSSQGRGNRAAGWFADYLQDQHDSSMRSYVLVDGIKGWSDAGKEYIEFMDEYQKEAWGK